jgi:hypothetical protein
MFSLTCLSPLSRADDQGKIPTSLNTQEIQRVSQRADDLRHAGDRVDLRIVSPSPPPQRVLPHGSVDLMPVISSIPYPTTSWEERPAPPSKGEFARHVPSVVQPIECRELTGPRPSHGASLTSQPLDPSLPPYEYYIPSDPPRAPPAPSANKGVPSDGPVSHPHPLPPPMTPQVPVTGRNMDMHWHTAQSQSFGEIRIREWEFGLLAFVWICPNTPLRISGVMLGTRTQVQRSGRRRRYLLATSLFWPGLATMPPHHFPRLTLLRPTKNVLFYLHRVSRKSLPSTLALRLAFPSLTSLPLSTNRESRPISGHPLLRKTSWSTWMPKRSLSPVDQLPRIRPCMR